MPRADPGLRRLARLRRRDRQDEIEAGALAGRAFHLDAAAMVLEDAVHHRKTEAGALADRLRREEGLEDARERRLVHAAAGVGDRKAEMRSIRVGPEAHGDFPLRLADRMSRVGHEIDDDLLKLA